MDREVLILIFHDGNGDQRTLRIIGASKALAGETIRQAMNDIIAANVVERDGAAEFVDVVRADRSVTTVTSVFTA